MIRKAILLALSMVFGTVIIAQNASDALRYSRIFYGGTARFQGMAGSFGALGADFSVIATNPAGIGLYKSSEITFTPSVPINTSISDYQGESVSSTKSLFTVGNFGFIFTVDQKKNVNKKGPASFNFGFGLNRQNDFNARIYMQGMNNTSSLMTDYINQLNYDLTVDPSFNYNDINALYPFDIALATNANLIYFDSTDSRFHCDAPNGGVYQQKYINTWGSINEFAFSFGGNLNDVLYFGATFGIPVLRYYEESVYEEYKVRQSIPYFQSLTYGQYLETHGTGINLKAGVIYRPANWIRIGASVHTPTYFGNMKDEWSSYMFANLDSLESIPQYSPLGYYDYQMMTPFRAIGSLGFVIGQLGIINAEYEYVNYNQARFYSPEGSNVFSDVNKDIKSDFKTPVNVRLGMEWRVDDFRIRGGFGYYGQPYKSGINTGEKYVASGGLGYRGTHFFGDLSYVWSKMNQEHYFYDRNLVNPSFNTYYSNTILATIGFRF